jgi:predicted alpha-1,2-mannosidase
MKESENQRLQLAGWICLALFFVNVRLHGQDSNPPDALHCVDPFIGVDGGGNLEPGACLPFSMVRLGPDTLDAGPSAYRSGKPMLGFSENHLSGTGGKGRYCNVRVTPQTGELNLTNFSSVLTNEYAEPDYYSATMEANDVKAELTCTERCGVHRYTFPGTNTARILIDASSTWSTEAKKNQTTTCTGASAKLISDFAVEGSATCHGGWGNDAIYTIYFAAEFDRPFAACGTWNGETVNPDSKEVKGKKCGVYVEFKATDGNTVGLRVGISYVGLENARKNLTQTDGRTFDQVKAAGQQKWRDFLGKIEVQGGTPEQRQLFYTALYRTVVMPTDVTGENPRWQSSEPHFWDFYTFWDTYHCNNSLYTLIVPDHESDIIRCALDIFQNRTWLPDAWVAGDYASVQGGINADNVIADGVVKGLKGFNLQLAYEAVKKDASVPSPDYTKYGRAPEYFTLGYLHCDSLDAGNEFSVPTSRTLEYAMNDFAAAQIARAVGETNDAENFTRRSLSGFSLFNPKTKFFWARNRQGIWLDGFDPDLQRRSWQGPYYEGTPWQYAFYVNHDIQGLINRRGGNEPFVAALDQLFDGNHYNPGNEPDLLSPWLYTYAGRPDKNVDRVHALLAKYYHAARTGWPGNDDAGTMSAWYVFGAMGFFPNTGQDVYLLASPIFSQVTMHLGGGKAFQITANNLSEDNKYVQSATLNGKPWEKGWFRHQDIIDGADLVLEMGPAPSDWGTKAEPPPSVEAATKAKENGL